MHITRMVPFGLGMFRVWRVVWPHLVGKGHLLGRLVDLPKHNTTRRLSVSSPNSQTHPAFYI